MHKYPSSWRVGPAIHTASRGDATSADLDSAVVAEVLLLDQGTAAAKIRDELGWRPARPSLAAEFRHGSYRR